MLSLCAGEESADAVDAYYSWIDAYYELPDELTETFIVDTAEAPAASITTVETLRGKDGQETRCRRSRKSPWCPIAVANR